MTSKTRHEGAEAIVEVRENHVVKKREPKEYRHPALDERIIKNRTEQEARIIDKASKYNLSPKLIKKDKDTLKVERINGTTIKNILSENSDIVRKIGKKIAVLHRENIVHGDLTTKNILLEDETNSVYLIDFGLSEHSQRVEDKAVDLHLFKEVLKTSHSEIFEESWDEFKDSYNQEYRDAYKVLTRLKEIEKRGRYK